MSWVRNCVYLQEETHQCIPLCFSLFVTLIKIIVTVTGGTLIKCGSRNIDTPAREWRSEDSFQELLLSFLHGNQGRDTGRLVSTASALPTEPPDQTRGLEGPALTGEISKYFLNCQLILL